MKTSLDHLPLHKREQLAAIVAMVQASVSSITERARLIGGRVPVTFVAHHIKEINQEIRVGQYFFSDVVTEGGCLESTRLCAHRAAVHSHSRLP